MRSRSGSGNRVVVLAYTEYPYDPRVRREAEALAKEGYQVHVIAAKSRGGPLVGPLAGVRVHEVPLATRRGAKGRYLYQYVLFGLLSAAWLVPLHFRHRFNLVHVHSPPDFQVFTAIPLKLIGIPVVLDLRESTPELARARFGLSTESILFRALVGLQVLSCRAADHVVVACEGIREMAITRRLPPDRITTVQNTVVVEDHRPTAEELRRRLSLPRESFIVHASGLNPERDLETLIRAVARLSSDFPLHVVFAGEGEPSYVSKLRRLAQDLGVANRMHFVGRLAPVDAQALVSLSEIGVVTSESNPNADLGWPTRLSEFATFGKPLILPRLKSLSAALSDRARFYTPGDAASLSRELAAMLFDANRRAQFAKMSQEVGELVAWKRIREVLLSVFRALRRSPSNQGGQ